MKLNVGERLEGAGPLHQPGGYVVTSVVRETPWYGLYVGKKIFYNFDFTAKRVRETDDVEWLDVFLRTNRYPILDDPTYVQQRRALARAEVRAILGNRHSNLWPEPLDLLEIENTRDPFAFSTDGVRTGEPIVVYTRPHGRFTPEWQQQILPISSILSVLAELLEFLKQAHAEDLLLLGLGPAALLIDASDRVHYIGTEMVLSQQSVLLKDTTPAATWQRLFPTERFARGYAAPECFDPSKRPDVRADLYAWGTLAFSLLTGIDLGKVAEEQGRPWTYLHRTTLEPARKAPHAATRQQPAWLGGADRRRAARAAGGGRRKFLSGRFAHAAQPRSGPPASVGGGVAGLAGGSAAFAGRGFSGAAYRSGHGQAAAGLHGRRHGVGDDDPVRPQGAAAATLRRHNRRRRVAASRGRHHVAAGDARPGLLHRLHQAKQGGLQRLLPRRCHAALATDREQLAPMDRRPGGDDVRFPADAVARRHGAGRPGCASRHR